MIPRPPISTLFPYTTLFRSLGKPLCCAWSRRTKDGDGKRRPRAGAGGAPGRRASREDRKSTRLNSSHLGISYAVFCLKKKTTDEYNEERRQERTSGNHVTFE